MDESLLVTLRIAEVLDDLKVRWFLGGSLASSIHGIPRATLDADVVADLRAPLVSAFLRALGKDWYMEEQSVRDAIRNRSCFNLIHLGSAMKVDIFVPKLRRFEGGQGRSVQSSSKNPIRRGKHDKNSGLLGGRHRFG